MSTNYRETYNEYHEKLWARKKELEKQISEMDSKQQDILHFLENEPCDAVTMVKVTKRLIALRKERRIIKNEWYDLEPVCRRLENKVKTKGPSTNYKYKTDIITECTGITVPH